MIVITLLFVFQCFSIAKAWDFSLDDRCIDIVKLIFDNAILNIVIDISIVIAPLSLIWILKITLHQKLTVCEISLMSDLLVWWFVYFKMQLTTYRVWIISMIRLFKLIHSTQVNIICELFRNAKDMLLTFSQRITLNWDFEFSWNQ